jgi:CRISPR/Cas system Type II protein with McrA/HNH and RuvC-like nuclease domain
MQEGLFEWIPRQHKAYMKKCLIEEWNNECAYCGYKQKHRELTIDHVVPLSKGGDDSYENQVPCCRTCNLSKNHKAVRQWYFDSEHYTTERWLKIKNHMNKEHPDVFAA